MSNLARQMPVIWQDNKLRVFTLDTPTNSGGLLRQELGQAALKPGAVDVAASPRRQLCSFSSTPLQSTMLYSTSMRP